MVKIAVLGAGINGLTCAVRIKEQYKQYQVVVIASEFTPHTTGDGSGGLWFPYLCGNTPEHIIGKWGCETYKFLHGLWLDGACEISLMPMYEFSKHREDIYKRDWMDAVFGYQRLNENQIQYFNQLYAAEYSAGHTFVTFVTPPPKLIGYFQKRFLKANGELIRAKLSSLDDSILSDYDIIVNCTGLGARLIVPDDRMTPIRGQVAKVQAPWLGETVIDNSTGRYIIPNTEFCILGGTHQHDYCTNVEEKDVSDIMNGCKAMIPGLKHAKLLTHWVGLRPGRDTVRIEKEEKDGKLYIHNYGHGGSGLTLFWGCSNEVMKILDTHLKNKKIMSKF